MQLRDAKKDLTEEFKIFEDGIVSRLLIITGLLAGFSEENCLNLIVKSWLEQSLTTKQNKSLEQSLNNMLH